MNGYSSYGGPSYLGAAPDAPPRHSSLRSGSYRLDPYSHRNSESSSIHSGISSTSRRSSSDSSKPRLSKEQQSFLEQQFNCNQKPNTETKKGFADTIGVSAEKVNNWFQNKRAKTRNDAKKTNGAQLAYQLYYQNGGNTQYLQAPYQYSSTNVAMDPNYGFHQFQQPPVSGHSGTFFDASMEPSLDVSNLANEESHMPHYSFQDTSQDTSQYHEPYGMEPQEDDMARFLGLGGQVDSIDNLQQQQRRFGSGAAMGTISEEAEDGNPHPSAASQEPCHRDHMMANLNDSIDPAAFEMPFDAYAYAPDQGPNATWGASAGTQEQENIPAPPPPLPPHYPSSLPFRNHEQDYSPGMNPQYNQTFEHPPQRQMGSFPNDDPMVSAQQQPHGHQHQHHSFNGYLHVSPPVLRTTSISREEALDQNLSPTTPDGPRRDSIVSSLADHVGQVNVQGHWTGAQDPTAPFAIAHPAPRRNRRPPPLSTSIRSSSHGISVPPSPRTIGLDAQLRRIKSSGNFAGRVQKSGSSSAQRSPMTANFNHTELTRSISGQSMANFMEEMWPHESKGPMTPASPAPYDNKSQDSHQSLSTSMSMPQMQQAYREDQMTFDAAAQPTLQHQLQQHQYIQQSPHPTMPSFFPQGPLPNSQHNTPLQNQMSPPETPSHFINTFAKNPNVAVHSHNTASTQPSPNNVHSHQPRGSVSEQACQSPRDYITSQGSHAEQPFSAGHRGSSTSGHSNHVRTATTQYVGPPPARPHPNSSQEAGQTNGFSGPVYNRHNHSPRSHHLQTLESQKFESQPQSVHVNYGSHLQPQHQTTSTYIYDPNQQSHYHDPRMSYLATQPPSLLSDRRSSSNNPAHLNHRPTSASLTQSKSWRSTNPNVTSQQSGAFGTWDLNEGRRTEPSPSPPQEKQYTFLHVDGVNGISSPKRPPTKPAEPMKSYEKIEFCHTSPKAFERKTSGAEVGG